MKSESTLKRRLNYVDSVTGMFHLQMSVLVLLYRTHLGSGDEICSLERWISELERNRNRLWDADKNHVKNYRACDDLFETVLDGYLVGSLVKSCGHSTTAGFLAQVAEHPSQLSEAIRLLAAQLAQMNSVAGMQALPSE
jgi:hypothetical protein